MRFVTTLLVFCVAALLALGTVTLYSSPEGTKLLSRQLLWCGAGFVVAALAAVCDYRILRKATWVLFPLTVLLLAAVLVPGLGAKRGGAMRWFDLHFMMFQPSELAKLTLIMALAVYIERFQRHMGTFRRGMLYPGLLVLPVLVLVFREPDYGTTILLATVAGILLLISGVRLSFLIPVMLIGVTAISFSILNNSVRMKRITAFLNPEETKSAAGFQSYQAMLALGSGGWQGLGLGNGRQKMGFVPENHTDFILSIIGEELGLIATLLLLAAFVTLVLCGLYIASRASCTFGRVLACGITFLIGLQAAINVGVVTSALPNKGLPLPFVSYGGSNLVMMLGAVGILISIARLADLAPEKRRKNVFSDLASAQLS